MISRSSSYAARGAFFPPAGVVVGIENRLGLKYLLGAKDDHTGRPGISVLDSGTGPERYRALTGQPLRVFTYSQEEYRQMLLLGRLWQKSVSLPPFPTTSFQSRPFPSSDPGALDYLQETEGSYPRMTWNKLDSRQLPKSRRSFGSHHGFFGPDGIPRCSRPAIIFPRHTWDPTIRYRRRHLLADLRLARALGSAAKPIAALSDERPSQRLYSKIHLSCAGRGRDLIPT